jgi:cell fate regulator YaaT (PSP1 superfamily)
LVKDLASVFRTRIELRQIGVRDEAKMIGGLGPCGLTLCCSTFLGDFAPVSIKMAKEQSLSLNPTKISGICGRLFCCLNYEQETYEGIRKRLPRVNSILDTPYGKGEVVSNNVIKESVKVKIKMNDTEEIIEIPIAETTLVSGGFEGTVNDEEIKIEAEDDDQEIIKELFKEN